MPDKVKLNEELGIIEIYAYGELTVKQMAKSDQEIRRHHEATGISRVLVNASEISGMPSTTDLFELLTKVPDFIRLAVVMPKNSPVHEDQRFASTVVLNRGGEYRVFDSAAAALEWLTDEG